MVLWFQSSLSNINNSAGAVEYTDYISAER